MINILLVDDQPTVRQGLRMRLALESDVQIVGEASDATAALELAPVLCPDVVVMDIEMPGIDGLAATRELHTVAPHSAVVILTLYDDAATRRRAHDAGAVAFVGKHEAAEALPAAIRQAAEGAGNL